MNVLSSILVLAILVTVEVDLKTTLSTSEPMQENLWVELQSIDPSFHVDCVGVWINKRNILTTATCITKDAFKHVARNVDDTSQRIQFAPDGKVQGLTRIRSFMSMGVNTNRYRDNIAVIILKKGMEFEGTIREWKTCAEKKISRNSAGMLLTLLWSLK